MASTDPEEPATRPTHSDSSPWNWLLAVPIVLPLLTPLYNHEDPRLFGFPAFYWLQLAFVLVGVAATVAVYRLTRDHRDPAGPRAERGRSGRD